MPLNGRSHTRQDLQHNYTLTYPAGSDELHSLDLIFWAIHPEICASSAAARIRYTVVPMRFLLLVLPTDVHQALRPV